MERARMAARTSTPDAIRWIPGLLGESKKSPERVMLGFVAITSQSAKAVVAQRSASAHRLLEVTAV
jgi:hypothetical protein